MNSGYYAAMTGLVARTQALDTAAANLANAQTPGYRAEREFFRSTLLGPNSQDCQLGHAINNYGLVGGDQISQAQGALQLTGNPLDVAVQGSGYFEIMTANGVRFTRDGSFQRTPTGRLVTASGDPVLSSTGQVIDLPPGQVSIGENGSISVAGGAGPVLGVFDFPKGTQLKPEGTNHYVAPEGVQPQLARNSTVHQGALEAANEDVIQGTLDIIMMQRQAEMMQKALTIFHTEFNKIASEDLAKV